MSIWLFRAGSHGEYEQKFLQESQVCVTREGLDLDIGQLGEHGALVTAMTERYPEAKPTAIVNPEG